MKKRRTTEAEYNAALSTISALVDKGDDTTPEETAYLALLGTLAEDYERRHYREIEEFKAAKRRFNFFHFFLLTPPPPLL